MIPKYLRPVQEVERQVAAALKKREERLRFEAFQRYRDELLQKLSLRYDQDHGVLVTYPSKRYLFDGWNSPMVHTYQVLKSGEVWASVIASRVDYHATREKAVAYLLAWC